VTLSVVVKCVLKVREALLRLTTLSQLLPTETYVGNVYHQAKNLMAGGGILEMYALVFYHSLFAFV